jgi:hypothetical protein
VRTPDTTSSPWAFGRNPPDGVGSPVTSSRENATPLHEVSPLLPNTICWTLTAVPHSSGMRLMRRYSTARLPIQESNTARIDCSSCSRVSCGKSYSSRKAAVSPRSAAASSSVSSSTPRSLLCCSMSSSKRSLSMPMTTLPNICTKRR